MRKMSLARKQLTIGILLTAVPLLVIGTAVWLSNRRTEGIVHEGAVSLAHADLDHVAQLAYLACETSIREMERRARGALQVAHHLAARRGGFSLDGKRDVRWHAKNQLTSAVQDAVLPAMSIGGGVIEQNRDAGRPSDLVDEIRAAAGVSATVFERMNDAGDMLRVSTNVIGADGQRAIGTFVGATNPDGKPNAVVAAVLRGEQYIGRAFVVNEWYLAAYEPIKDGGRVIGMLFVGVPEKQTAEELLARLKDIRIAQSGYVYILRGSGEARGSYILSLDRKRDGENIWSAQDASGAFFIQEIVKRALALQAGEADEYVYPWKNAGDAEPAMKIARFKYFAPWDWIVAASVPQAEYLVTAEHVASVKRQQTMLLAALTLGALVVSFLVWTVVSRRMTAQVSSVVANLITGAGEVVGASGQVSTSAQSLAQGASEQTASLEKTSHAMDAMAALTRRQADGARAAAELMIGAEGRVAQSRKALDTMMTSMDAIEHSSQKIGTIIKTIDEIAFQTNILALNAAVEAARAGQAGLGFAVVADEVRNLAQRSAHAANETKGLIEEAAAKAQAGTSQVTQVTSVIGGIAESVGKAKSVIDQMSAASSEQTQSIDEVLAALTAMERVTHSAAATAEENAAASEELNAQAETAIALVQELESIVGGTHSMQRAAVGAGTPLEDDAPAVSARAA